MLSGAEARFKLLTQRKQCVQSFQLNLSIVYKALLIPILRCYMLSPVLGATQRIKPHPARKDAFAGAHFIPCWYVDLLSLVVCQCDAL